MSLFCLSDEQNVFLLPPSGQTSVTAGLMLQLQEQTDPLLCFPSGYMLIGSDVKLNSPMSLVGQALAEILQYPEKARDALRVLLHLVRRVHARNHHEKRRDVRLETLEDVSGKNTTCCVN